MAINWKSIGEPETAQEVRKAKRVNFVALLMLLGLIGGSLFIFFQMLDQKEKLRVVASELEEKNQELELVLDELAALKEKEAARAKRLEAEVGEIQQRVNEDYAEIDLPLLDTILEQIGEEMPTRKEVTVALYSTRAVESTHQKVRDWLILTPDFSMIKQDVFPKQQGWMAKAPTVYYFMEGHEEAARELVNRIRDDLGVGCTLKQMPSGQKAYRNYGSDLHIHLVKAEADQ